MPSPADSLRLPVLHLAGGLLVCSLVGGGAGLLIANAQQNQAADSASPVAAAAVAIGSSIVASLAGVALLQLVATRIDRFGTGFLAASGSRILVGVLMCLVTAQVLALKGTAVWYSFLGAALLCLVFETAWAVKVNSRLVHEHLSLPAKSASSATGVAS